MPKPQEIAILRVRESLFQDWETVFVQQRWADSFTYFRFTAAERDTVFASETPQWARLQFKPGDPCMITLAGQTAVTGVIETRQVAYDAHNHAVQLIGKSLTAGPARSSVDTKTGNFDGMTFEQIARKVLAPYKVGIETVGVPNATPFQKMQNQPGELIWDFLERIARPLGIIMGSDAKGNFLIIGDHVAPVVSDLIEGKNIKSCQAVMDKSKLYDEYRVISQNQGSDSNSGTQASEQEASVGSIVPDIPRSVLITPAEQPVKSIVELLDRAKNEALWHDGTIINVTIVTQGWLCDGINLWRPGTNVMVKSPMAMLNMPLKIQNATFTQDNQNGTQTSLDLVPPWALKDGSQWNVGKTGDAAFPQNSSYQAPTQDQQSVPA